MESQPTIRSKTFRDYLAILERQKWLVLIAVVLVPVLAVTLSMRQQRLYESSAQVLISRQNPAAVLFGTQETSPQVERAAQTEADVARVSAVATRTLKAAGVRTMTPSEFLAASDASAKTNTDLLEFLVTLPDPKLAVRLATAYARQYTLYRRELDTAALDGARAAIERRLEGLKGAVRRRGSLRGSDSALALDADSRSALLASLVEKAEQLRAASALLASKFILIKPATEAKNVRPRPVRSGVLGVVLGLALGVGLAFFREALDTRPRSGLEIGAELGLPLLARLPAPSRSFRKGGLVMLDEPRGIGAEAFRVLRVNLDLLARTREGGGAVMLTSALEGEGKSTTAANLAVGLAQSGRRVILADLDLRRPGVGRLFNLNGRAGLTDVVLAHVRPETALTPIPLGDGQEHVGRADHNGRQRDGTLEVLTAGSIPVEAGDFVSSEALAETLAALRERADIVIVDAPPLLGVGDAMALSARVDGLILVTRLHVIRRQVINELRAVLRACPATKLGFVLTGTDQKAVYGEGYGQGYAQMEKELAA